MSQLSAASAVFQRWSRSIRKGEFSRAAKKLGVNRRTLSRWQTGRDINPTLKNIEAMAEMLDVTVAEIISEDWSPESPYRHPGTELPDLSELRRLHAQMGEALEHLEQSDRLTAEEIDQEIARQKLRISERIRRESSEKT